MSSVEDQRKLVEGLYQQYLTEKDNLREMESRHFMEFDPDYIFIVHFRREFRSGYAESFLGAVQFASKETGDDKYLNVSRWGISAEYGYGNEDDIPVYDGEVVFKYHVDPNFLDGNVWIVRVPLFKTSLSEN